MQGREFLVILFIFAVMYQFYIILTSYGLLTPYLQVIAKWSLIALNAITPMTIRGIVTSGTQPNQADFEWLAYLIDGDGSFELSRDKYGSLKIVI